MTLIESGGMYEDSKDVLLHSPSTSEEAETHKKNQNKL